MNRRKTLMTGLAGITAAAAFTPKAGAAAVEAKAKNPELKNVRALLKAHDGAMTNHDLDAVMATFAPEAVIMGTGPGELYSGTDEIKVAYEHFFQGFDKGEQDFTYHSRSGGLSTDMGWLVTSGEIKGKHEGKDIAFPINISLTVAKAGDKWQFVAMHFSTLTSAEGDKASK